MKDFKYAEMLFIARTKAGLSQQALSNKIRTLNTQMIGRYENAKVIPRVDKWEKWLEACGYEMVIREKKK